jgi:hypothetical protein
MKTMQWVPVPIKHDGYGYCLLTATNGAARLGAWLAILQTAAKSHPRGTLLRDGKHPHTSNTIATKTRLEQSIIEETITECLKPEIGWLEYVDYKAVIKDGAEIPQEGAEIPQEPARKGREWKGIEEKEEKEDCGSKIIEIQDHYNSVRCEMPECIKITTARQKQISARLEEVGLEELKRIITECKDMPHLQGKNDRGWKADLEWITKAENFTKIREGRYKQVKKLVFGASGVGF